MSSPKHKQLMPLRRPRAILVLFVSLAVGAAVISTSAPSPALVAGPELVVNGSFDDGTVGWRTNDARNSTLAVVSGDGAGPYASVTSSSTRTVVLNDRVNTVARTTAGTRYRVSASVRGSQPKVSGQLRVREVAGKDVTVHRSTFYLTDTGWTTVEVEFETVSDGGSLDLNVLAWKNAAGRALEIDDVSMMELFEPGTEPTPTPTPTATPTTSVPTPPAPTAS
ncbi:carbohydrate binding domain-containing protein, partial [Mumia zhuanghuii]